MTNMKARQFLRSHVLGLLAIFIALTGTAVAGQQSGGGPSASASAVTTAKFKKLKARVAALEGKVAGITIPTTLPPSGPAGGSLTGNFPNPTIGANKVGSNEIVNGSVGAAEIADGSVGSAEVADGSLSGGDLKNTYTAVSAGSTVAANTYTTQIVECGSGTPNDRLLAGGYAWSSEGDVTPPASIETVANAPFSFTTNPQVWTVTSRSSKNNDTLFAWAVCLSI